MTIIENAILTDVYDGKKIELDQEKVKKLNTLLQDGIEEIDSEKWQVWNFIEAKLKNNETIIIYSYKGGYLGFSSSNKYFKVKQPYLHAFYEIFGRGLEDGHQ